MNKKGFTLIELLVVISIIAMLAAITLASLKNARYKAHDAQRLSDLHQISLALELYASDNAGAYPYGSFDSRTAGWSTFAGYLTSGGYMKTVPVDPNNNSGEGAMCGNCGEYFYVSAVSNKYIISTYLSSTESYQTSSNTFGPYYSKYMNCTPVAGSMGTCN